MDWLPTLPEGFQIVLGRYALLQNIFYNLSLIDIYDSEPALGISRNDLQIRSSIGIKF